MSKFKFDQDLDLIYDLISSESSDHKITMHSLAIVLTGLISKNHSSGIPYSTRNMVVDAVSLDDAINNVATVVTTEIAVSIGFYLDLRIECHELGGVQKAVIAGGESNVIVNLCGVTLISRDKIKSFSDAVSLVREAFDKVGELK